MKAVPSWAACAPRSSMAAIPAPAMTLPAAIIGTESVLDRSRVKGVTQLAVARRGIKHTPVAAGFVTLGDNGVDARGHRALRFVQIGRRREQHDAGCLQAGN